MAVASPSQLHAVGQFYRHFPQVSDDEVARCLAAGSPTEAPPGDDPPLRDGEVTIPVGATSVVGRLVVPEEPLGLVVFAHGSGSGMHSPRNRLVASVLNEARLATLLLDLLTPEDEQDRAFVFDVELLGRRLTAASAWARELPEVSGRPVGYFGASTGAAAALWAATESRAGIAAVVSRGGRPDLAERRLGLVSAPTLLLVGERDPVVLGLNRAAESRMRCERSLVVVPGASHLFVEPGALEIVCREARGWFVRHFAATPAPAASR